MEMETVETPQIRRSISMPVKPRPLESKSLQRSEEKEIIFSSADYYPESPELPRSSKLHADNGITRSANTFPCNSTWVGSTIELNRDAFSVASDTMYEQKRRGHRVIEKNGDENVSYKSIPQKSWRYIRDFVTTLIELDWKYMLIMFVSSYFLSWTLFAVLCYLAAYSHGDMLFDAETGERLGEGKEPCFVGVYDFMSMFIYSVETQTTIGFGEKYPSDECPESIFLFIMQIICSICMEGMLISIIYAKAARPVRQLTKMKFSDKAVICYRNGKLCLLFRVCDPRQQHTIESKIYVYLIIERLTQEGELLQTHTELKVENNGQQIIVWPEIVCHVIDEKSPLRFLRSAKDLNAATFELYVSIVGTSAATAMVTEARTSYVPRDDIFWGQRFINIISYDALNERYVVDYGNFNTTISVDMPNNEADTSVVGAGAGVDFEKSDKDKHV